MSPQVNESLSQLLRYTRSFRLHVDWLKTAKENVSLSSRSTGGAGAHLLRLSDLLTASLLQVRRPARLIRRMGGKKWFKNKGIKVTTIYKFKINLNL